ncbi:MAG TPA: CopG family antitoxin [Anaerolineales bacterium]|nr:CopG family antitoxin [Anaerolineales bacterium]
MAENKKTLPKFDSLDAAVNFFDENDMGDYLDSMPEVEFEIDLQADKTYYAVDSQLSTQLRQVAKKRGVSAETLLNLWVQEKLMETGPKTTYQVAEK